MSPTSNAYDAVIRHRLDIGQVVAVLRCRSGEADRRHHAQRLARRRATSDGGAGPQTHMMMRGLLAAAAETGLEAPRLRALEAALPLL